MRTRVFTLLAGTVAVLALALAPASPAHQGHGGHHGHHGGHGCTPPYCPSHRLKVNKGGNGGGAVAGSPAGIDCGPTCEADFEQGTEVTLTATAAPGSSFDGWAGAGCSGAGACVVTIDRDTTVTAIFHAHPPHHGHRSHPSHHGHSGHRSHHGHRSHSGRHARLARSSVARPHGR